MQRRFCSTLFLMVMGTFKMLSHSDFPSQRQEMVSVMCMNGVVDPHVLRAMSKVPRHLFVEYEWQGEAYADHEIPIGFDQIMSQPIVVGLMIQEARLNPAMKVLEIGTGRGYQTAVLAEICRCVYTIEIISPLAHRASAILDKLNYHHVHFKIGNGYDGWAQEAPFDAIIVSAASKTLPKNLLHQLVVGGIMMIPLEDDEGDYVLTKITKTSKDDDYTRENIIYAHFMPMRGDDDGI